MGYILEFNKWRKLNESIYFKGGKFAHLFDTAMYVMGKLVNEYKYSPKLAAALCGNIFAESVFDPKKKSSTGHYGLVQWGGTRLTSLKKLPDHQSIDGQLKFIDIELNSKYFTVTKPVKPLVVAATTIDAATDIITLNYEGAAPSSIRRDSAKEIYNEYLKKSDEELRKSLSFKEPEINPDEEVSSPPTEVD